MRYEALRLDYIRKITSGQTHCCLSFSLYQGESLCIITEDQESKLFLLDIFQGKAHPQAGNIYINGQLFQLSCTLENFHHHGIYYVCESQLILSMNVADNLFLTEDRFYNPVGVLNGQVIHRETSLLLEKFSLDHIKTHARMENLSAIDRFLISILKAFVAGAKVIVTDNIHDNIANPADIRKIQHVLSILKEENIAVLCFTPKWHTLFQNFDRYGMIKDGVVTELSPLTEIPPAISMEEQLFPAHIPEIPENSSQVIFECRNFPVRNSQKTVFLNFSVREGEILGVSDIDGQLGRALCEIWEGECQRSHYFLHRHQPCQIKPGQRGQIACIVNDYHGSRIFPYMSLYDNIALLTHKPIDGLLGIMNTRIRNHIVRTTLESLHQENLLQKYKEPDSMHDMTPRDQFIVEIAKWLCAKADMFIFINNSNNYTPLSQQQFKDLIIILRGMKIPVLIVSDNVSSLPRLCSRVIVVS